jgi:hypothetical protein
MGASGREKMMERIVPDPELTNPLAVLGRWRPDAQQSLDDCLGRKFWRAWRLKLWLTVSQLKSCSPMTNPFLFEGNNSGRHNLLFPFPQPTMFRVENCYCPCIYVRSRRTSRVFLATTCENDATRRKPDTTNLIGNCKNGKMLTPHWCLFHTAECGQLRGRARMPCGPRAHIAKPISRKEIRRS